eukprot:1147639-Pelagomonas_calceolata.AAC.1
MADSACLGTYGLNVTDRGAARLVGWKTELAVLLCAPLCCCSAGTYGLYVADRGTARLVGWKTELA